jgi:hypothetical protein
MQKPTFEKGELQQLARAPVWGILFENTIFGLYQWFAWRRVGRKVVILVRLRKILKSVVQLAMRMTITADKCRVYNLHIPLPDSIFEYPCKRDFLVFSCRTPSLLPPPVALYLKMSARFSTYITGRCNSQPNLRFYFCSTVKYR